MNHFSKTVLTTIITSLGVAIPAMSMETMDLKTTDVANSTTVVSPKVAFIIDQTPVKKNKHRNDSPQKRKKLSKQSDGAINVDTQPITNLLNEVENTVEVIKETVPVKGIDSQTLSDLSTELNTVIDKGNSCCLWCISETTKVAQNLNELVVEISKVDQAIESNVTAVTQLVDTVKDFNKLTPKEQQLQKNNLKVNMKNAKAALEHHKIMQKNKPASKEIKVEI